LVGLLRAPGRGRAGTAVSRYRVSRPLTATRSLTRSLKRKGAKLLRQAEAAKRRILKMKVAGAEEEPGPLTVDVAIERRGGKVVRRIHISKRRPGEGFSILPHPSRPCGCAASDRPPVCGRRPEGGCHDGCRPPRIPSPPQTGDRVHGTRVAFLREVGNKGARAVLVEMVREARS